MYANNPELQAAILEGVKLGAEKVTSASKNLGNVENRWTIYPQGEYFGSNYEDRTKVAKVGIYANSPFAAFYLNALVDESRENLN